ncbi:hypothetical protein IAT38_001376 [Cryptococcus sp. DSM 104549]
MVLAEIKPFSKAHEGYQVLPTINPDSGAAPSRPPSSHPPPSRAPKPRACFGNRWEMLVMRFMFSIVISILIFSYAFLFYVIYNTWAHPHPPTPLSDWLPEERALAMQRILLNIGPAAGADDGLVIASPSIGNDDEPNYYYTWTRDSALTMSTLLPYVFTSHQDPNSCLRIWTVLMEPLFRHYIESQAKLQVGVNPSGGLTTGGLNEPKFNVNGTAFTGSWGRPQRDGPALRALVITRYAEFILDRGFPADLKYVEEYLYSPKEIRTPGKVIKNDLEEVAHGWWKGGFDLWEEVNGHHLFTLLASRKALQAGASLAARLNDPYASRFYAEQAQLITASLPKFWDDHKGYWRSSLSYKDFQVPHGNLTSSVAGPEKRTEDGQVYQEGLPGLPNRQWLDCSLPLSLIHTTEQGNATLAGESLVGLSPSSDKVLSSLRAYILSFEGLYGVNREGDEGKDRSWWKGWALGRYREDVYTGNGTGLANPWYICTYSLAHSLYLARDAFLKQGYIPITPLSQPFWTDVTSDQKRIAYRLARLWRSPVPKVGETWYQGTKEFDHALEQLALVADLFVKAGAQSAKAQGGRMSEQFGRDDGLPKGARDLTWSYASLFDMSRARRDGGDGVGWFGGVLPEGRLKPAVAV